MGIFLLPQLIYGGKASRWLLKFDFPDFFSLSFNEKHFSNTNETKNLSQRFWCPSLITGREKLQQDPDQKGLVVLDVFRGQINEESRDHQHD